MEDKPNRLFEIALLGVKMINTMAIIGLFALLVNLHFKMFNYWDLKQVELMLAIVGIGGGCLCIGCGRDKEFVTDVIIAIRIIFIKKYDKIKIWH